MFLPCVFVLFCRHVCLISRQCFDPALISEARRQLQDAQLAPLGQLVTEAAAAYYSSSAARLRQKQLDITAALGSSPPEVNAATAFKVGVGCWVVSAGVTRGLCSDAAATKGCCVHMRWN
jgi:hypothetical protein